MMRLKTSLVWFLLCACVPGAAPRLGRFHHPSLRHELWLSDTGGPHEGPDVGRDCRSPEDGAYNLKCVGATLYTQCDYKPACWCHLQCQSAHH